MGEIADLMLEGHMCQWCGETMDGDGYPQVCRACQIENNVDQFGNEKKEKVPCPICKKKVKKIGLAMHVLDVHKRVL